MIPQIYFFDNTLLATYFCRYCVKCLTAFQYGSIIVALKKLTKLTCQFACYLLAKNMGDAKITTQI